MKRRASAHALSQMRIASLVVAGFVFMLHGCAGVSPDKLQPADPDKVALIKPDFSYESHHAVFGIRWRWTLVSGRYVAHKQDPVGVYYLGPPQCLTQTLIDGGLGMSSSMVGRMFASVGCGIYVPHDARQDPKVFIVMGSWTNYPDGKTPVAAPETPDLVATQAIAQSAVPNTTYLQAGVGGAIGGGIVAGVLAAEEGNYEVARNQPSGSDLRRALDRE